MKAYKKLMNVVAAIEKIILVITMLLILVLTVGNVFSRYVIHRSWSFTEELVVAVFVLITLLAAALSCREGELVNLTLLTDNLPAKLKKPSVILITICCVIFSAVLFKYGLEKVLTQMANGKRTFRMIQHEPELTSFGMDFYLHELSLAALEGQSEQDWKLRLEGRLFETGKKMNITSFEVLRDYIKTELNGITIEEATT